MYFNSQTGEVSENHPMDEYFKSLYQKLRDDPVSNRVHAFPTLNA